MASAIDWAIALAVVLAWITGVYVLYRKGKIRKEGAVSLFGPAVMLKTTRGKRWIESVGRNRVWEAYGYLAVLLSFIIMVLVFSLMVWQAYVVTTIPASKAPSPVEALGIPGINPVIPIWYGILGLVVAIVFHELSHGLLVAYHRMKILSLGVLLFVFPIGAFVEPDEDELAKAERIKRMHVFAAGPTTNIILALVFIILFSASLSAVHPNAPGLYVASVGGVNSGVFQIGDIIEEINGTPVRSVDDFLSVNAPMPGESVDVKIYRNGDAEIQAVSGVVVMSVIKGYPAEKAGIKPGWIIYSINNTVVRNMGDFYESLNRTRAGEAVSVVMLDENHTFRNITVVLGDKYDYYEKYAPELLKEEFKGKGFLGVGAAYMGISVGDPENLKVMLANPYHGMRGMGEFFQRSMYLIALPFMGLMPFPAEYENIFAAPFPGFWIMVNSFYWIFWLNLMLGLTNLLPAVPLDGGYLFRDAVDYLARKLKVKNPERVVGETSTFVSLLILVLILWQFIGPRI